MKTTIATIFTVIALVLITNFTFAANQNGTVLSGIGKFSKIEVHGNVEVYVSNGNTNQVKVYNDYYAENAMVQSEGGVLRIASYTPEKLVVYVSAYDLQSISAFDNASIKSTNNLSYIDLTVDLHDNAYAKLNLDSFAASITVNDRAKADLSGSLSQYSLTYSRSSTVNRTELVAENASETITNPTMGRKHFHHIMPFIS